MSVHKSLRLGAGSNVNRSVLTRAERVAILARDGRLQPGQSVIGLPKVRVQKAVKKSKGKKKEAAAEGAAAPAAGAAAAPAAGAAKGGAEKKK
jgi:small basic protein (TIGR04137 family)